MQITRARRLQIVFALAFAAGWADVVSICRFHVFTGFMTGNILYGSVYLGFGVWDKALFYFMTTICNMTAPALFEAICSAVESQRSPRWLRNRAVSAVAPFAILAFFFGEMINQFAEGSKWQALCVSFAMGLQMSIGSKASTKIGVNTAVLTGNIQKLGSAVYPLLVKGSIGDVKAMETLEANIVVIIGTLAGALGCAGALSAAVRDEITSGAEILVNLPQDHRGGLWWSFVPALFAQLWAYLAHDSFFDGDSALTAKATNQVPLLSEAPQMKKHNEHTDIYDIPKSGDEGDTGSVIGVGMKGFGQ